MAVPSLVYQRPPPPLETISLLALGIHYVNDASGWFGSIADSQEHAVSA